VAAVSCLGGPDSWAVFTPSTWPVCPNTRESTKKARPSGESVGRAVVLASVNGAPLTENDLHNSAVLRKLDPDKLTDLQRSRLLGELVLAELVHQESLRKELHKQPVVVAQMAYAQRNILKQTLLNEYNRKHPVTDTEVEVFYKTNKSKI